MVEARNIHTKRGSGRVFLTGILRKGRVSSKFGNPHRAKRGKEPGGKGSSADMEIFYNMRGDLARGDYIRMSAVKTAVGGSNIPGSNCAKKEKEQENHSSRHFLERLRVKKHAGQKNVLEN